MKIAVLSVPEDMALLVPILEAFRGIEVAAYGLKIRSSWERLSLHQIARYVDKASHILVLCSPKSVASSWLPFAAGFGIGRGRGFSLYRVDPQWDPPRYLAGSPILDDVEELVAYYRAEKADWLIKEEKRGSRAALLEMGISFHAESFAQCVAEGNLKAVELFLKSGLHPDARDRHGVTLLCRAARSRHRAVAELLLEFGASIDLQSEDRGYSALMDASLQNAGELVELFLTRGADPDLTSKDGQTALIIAAGRGDLELCRKLLDYGADPDKADKLGLSARGYAKLFKSPELMALFEASSPTRSLDRS